MSTPAPRLLRLLIERSRLYIIEGIITVIWAGCCIFLVPKNYETAYFLNAEEKALMRQRAEEMESYSGSNGHYELKDIKNAAKDAKSWIHVCHPHTPIMTKLPADPLSSNVTGYHSSKRSTNTG